MSYRTTGGLVVGFIIGFSGVFAYQGCINSNKNWKKSVKSAYEGGPKTPVGNKRNVYEEYKGTSEADYRGREEKNWRTQNIIATCQVLVGFITVFASIIAVGIAIKAYYASNEAVRAAQRQADEAGRQTKAAYDTLAASQRAWIKADVSIGNQPMLTDKNGLSFSVGIKLKNIGNAPALQIRPIIVATREMADGLFVWQTRDKICSEARANPPFGDLFLFPDENYPQDIGIGSADYGVQIPTDKLGNLPGVLANPKTLVDISVVVCIDYTFPTDVNNHHQTSYIFSVGRNVTPYFIDSTERRIDPTELALREETGGARSRRAD